LFCGDGVSAGVVCGDTGLVRCDVGCVGTGRTTCSSQWEAVVPGRVSWAPPTFIATSSLSTAWLTYGSRSLAIVGCAGLPCAGCEPDDPVPCVAPDRSA
jgi:hypothetical protein